MFSTMYATRGRRHPIAPISGFNQGSGVSACAGTFADLARGPLTTDATDDRFWDPDAWSPPS